MNRIPTKLLGYQSPINMLNSNYPIIKLTSGLAARVFGCIAYVHLKSGKLDPKALKCVFVGYSSTQKGYWCYHPPTRKYYVSADVTFEEYQMYFLEQETSNNSGSSRNQMDAQENQFLMLPHGAILTDSRLPEIQALGEADHDNVGADNSLPHQDSQHSSPIANERLIPKPNGDIITSSLEIPNQTRPEVTQVYIRRPTSKTGGVDNHTAKKEENSDEHQHEDDSSWPIALCKGVRSCRNQVNYSLGQYISYDRLGN